MMDHSTMNHNNMNHGDKPPMGHTGHNHHAMMSPAAGAALMAVSTIVVAINASMLKVK